MNFRWLISTAILLVGCGQPDVVEDEPPSEIDSNFERVPMVLAGLQKAKADVSLHEGLPDLFWEPQLRQLELQRKTTTRFHGYPFYEEPCPLRSSDASQLKALFSAADTYREHGGLKTCGGYHPDYCVEWKTDDGPIQALVSLECGEVKMYGPQFEVHCDLSPAAVQKVKPLLEPYRKNRPVEEPTP